MTKTGRSLTHPYIGDQNVIKIVVAISLCPISYAKHSASFAGQSAIVANAANSLGDRFPGAL